MQNLGDKQRVLWHFPKWPIFLQLQCYEIFNCSFQVTVLTESSGSFPPGLGVEPRCKSTRGKRMGEGVEREF